jgi:hypothetical protein
MNCTRLCKSATNTEWFFRPRAYEGEEHRLYGRIPHAVNAEASVLDGVDLHPETVRVS